MTDDRPNILLIMTDQQSATAMSCAPNPDLHTPAMDALAAGGVRFGRAYCTNPLCAPSRASMMTGRMPSEIGVDDNVREPAGPLPARTLGRLFAGAGYDCAYAGKWHVPGLAPAGSGFRQLHAGGDDGLVAACRPFLADGDRRDTPFLLVASFNEPHGICEWARGQTPPSGDVDEADWRELPVLPANFAPGTEEPEALRLVQRFAWTVHPTQEWDEEGWRRYRHAYFRLCERVDGEIAALVAGLDASGLRERTVIVFTSDHGDMQGAHRWNQKKNLYEEASRVPFVVVPPSGMAGGRVRDELVSVGLDLLPTLCDYAGIEPDPDAAGTSVRPLVESGSGQPPSWRDQVVAETEWTFPGLMPPPVLARLQARMVRTERHKYQCYSWGRHREQLFDLNADPGEMVNLATSGAHQGVLDDHRRRLAAHCATLGDDFVRYVPGPGVPPR
ncbi:sulfatase [Jiangella asiatica]|uniref:Sulfatase n=1 Tax=Jiangella asiatica TaxID=2530372 RepID=A0A4R5CT87_9ACTN|nr:sulfatase-like hydrolase/transferase [Jiangella asiatica]TDE01015.1 sulfatase [Jiangella asiatica]